MKTIIAAATFATLAFAAAQPAHAFIGMNGGGTNALTTNALTTNAITVNGREINGREINGREINGGTSNGREINGGGNNGVDAQGSAIRGFEVQAITLPAEVTSASWDDEAPAFFFGPVCPVWRCGYNGTSLTGTILE